MYRKLVASFIACAASFVFLGPVHAQDDPMRMGVVVKIGGIPWFNAMEVGIEQRAEELGVEAFMVGPTSADPALQVRAIEDLIAQGVDVIGVVPNDAEVLEPVLQRAELGAFLRVGDPLGVGPHRGTAPLAIGGVLVHPDVDVLVDVAGFRDQVGERLAQVPGLWRLAQLLVEGDMRLDRSGPAGIGANVEQHAILLWGYRERGGGRHHTPERSESSHDTPIAQTPPTSAVIPNHRARCSAKSATDSSAPNVA